MVSELLSCGLLCFFFHYFSIFPVDSSLFYLFTLIFFFILFFPFFFFFFFFVFMHFFLEFFNLSCGFQCFSVFNPNVFSG
jgi:hypothetical protein